MHFVCTSEDLVAKALVSSAGYNKLPIKHTKTGHEDEKSSKKQKQKSKIFILFMQPGKPKA